MDVVVVNDGRRWISAALILLGLLAGCDQGKEAQAPPTPPSVGVKAAEIKGVARAYEFVGRIEAIDTVQVRARVEGFLEKVLFTEGQDVKAGELLYEIEKAQFQALVDQAKANVAAAEATTVNAELQYNRAFQLAKQQATAQAAVDEDKAALDTARAGVLQTRAALTQAQINLGYTDIHAPIDGRIGRTTYTLGNLVNAASWVLATIVSQDPIYVVFPVSQRELEDIREARRQADGTLIKIEIVVRLSNGNPYKYPGVWNFTDIQVNQQTDTLLMRASLPNPSRELTDGQFVTVALRERKEQPRLVVPQAALQIDQAGSYVLVVGADNKVEMRRVTPGPQDGTDIVITDGLQQGERVIVDGIQKVRVGQTVSVTGA